MKLPHPSYPLRGGERVHDLILQINLIFLGLLVSLGAGYAPR
jgi:hypothetical protein